MIRVIDWEELEGIQKNTRREVVRMYDVLFDMLIGFFKENDFIIRREEGVFKLNSIFDIGISKYGIMFWCTAKKYKNEESVGTDDFDWTDVIVYINLMEHTYDVFERKY